MISHNERWSIVLQYIVFVILISIFSLGCGKMNDKNTNRIIYSAPAFVKYDNLRKAQGNLLKKKFPNVEIVYSPISGQRFFDKILTQFASGTAPDVFYMRDFILPQFIQKQVLLPLNDFIKKDKEFNLKDYWPFLIDSYSSKNKIYGLPGSFTPNVIYYNENIFDEKGLPYPNKSYSWSELVDIGKKLIKKDNTGRVISFGITFGYYDWVTFIIQNRGRIFNDTGTKCIINSKASLKGIKYMKDLIKKYHIMPQPNDLENQSAYQIFMAGKTAMFVGGRWYTTIFRGIKGFKWSVAPLFHGKYKKVRIDSHSWVISKNTKNPKLAWELLKTICGKNGNKFMVDVGDSVPTLKTMVSAFIADKSFPNENNKVFINSLQHPYTLKNVMSDNIPWSYAEIIMKEEFQLFLMDKQSASVTLKNIQKRINKELSL